MTLLSKIAASVIGARPDKKRKFDELPARRQRYVVGHTLKHMARLIDLEYEEHCQRTRKRRPDK